VRVLSALGGDDLVGMTLVTSNINLGVLAMASGRSRSADPVGNTKARGF